MTASDRCSNRIAWIAVSLQVAMRIHRIATSIDDAAEGWSDIVRARHRKFGLALC